MTEYDKQELLEKGVTSDAELIKEEKETSITFPNHIENGLFYSDVPTTIKWFLSVEESIVEDVRFNESSEIIAVKGKIPKGILKLQGNARKSNGHSQMVSYGPNK
jgi:hypothetical protein